MTAINVHTKKERRLLNGFLSFFRCVSCCTTSATVSWSTASNPSSLSLTTLSPNCNTIRSSATTNLCWLSTCLPPSLPRRPKNSVHPPRSRYSAAVELVYMKRFTSCWRYNLCPWCYTTTKPQKDHLDLGVQKNRWPWVFQSRRLERWVSAPLIFSCFLTSLPAGIPKG